MKKRIVLMLVFMLTMSMSTMADNIKVITFNQLPAQAQAILKQHFADKDHLLYQCAIKSLKNRETAICLCFHRHTFHFHQPP